MINLSQMANKHKTHIERMGGEIKFNDVFNDKQRHSYLFFDVHFVLTKLTKRQIMETSYKEK